MLDGRRAAHVRHVLRAARGDELRVGRVRGPRGTGRVIDITGRRVRLQISWQEQPCIVPSIDLVLAMPRPKILSRVLQTAACLGVRRIDVVNAWRVDKSYFDSPRLALDAVETDLWLGCEQSATTWVPIFDVHRLLMPFMRGSLADRIANEQARGYIAHPRTTTLIEETWDALDPHFNPECSQVPLIIAIGPERGWIDRELDSFIAMGFDAVSLGHRVLRVEIAVTTVLAQVSLLQRLQSRHSTSASAPSPDV